VLASAEDEQTEECDVTASPNKESVSETGDSEADPKFSLSDHSYSDTSDKKSFSFDEVNVSALYELQNIDLTTEKNNRKPNNIKRQKAIPSEWKRNKTNLPRNTGHAYRSFKKGSEIPKREDTSPLCDYL
jgi:accessory colonization factor AcfC